jgi:hypothetical protein
LLLLRERKKRRQQYLSLLRRNLSPNQKILSISSSPGIIASDLHVAQEEKLLDVLREHKEAIGWTIEDIKGISPSVVMHKIHLEK